MSAKVWRVEFDRRAAKELRKLGANAYRIVLSYLRNEIATAGDPRRFGKPLGADKKGLWRYRIGDYRMLARIEDGSFVVLIVRVGHRSYVYD